MDDIRVDPDQFDLPEPVIPEAVSTWTPNPWVCAIRVGISMCRSAG